MALAASDMDVYYLGIWYGNERNGRICSSRTKKGSMTGLRSTRGNLKGDEGLGTQMSSKIAKWPSLSHISRVKESFNSRAV